MALSHKKKPNMSDQDKEPMMIPRHANKLPTSIIDVMTEVDEALTKFEKMDLIRSTYSSNDQ